MKKTLGGDRLGSGGKMTVNMHNYGRSTHNLGRAWRSTMAPGTLVPCLVEPILNGDTFDIDLTTLVRTLPTNGPIFGSFKMQIDVFSCPMRLYNAQLHNNALEIGLDMSKVKFPMFTMYGNKIDFTATGDYNQQQISQSSLISYMGVRGLGQTTETTNYVYAKTNAMYGLAYWDIYKNYYANKQEKIGYVIEPKPAYKTGKVSRAMVKKTPLSNWEDFDITQNQITLFEKYSLMIYGENLNENNVWVSGEPLKNYGWENITPLYNNTQVLFTNFQQQAYNFVKESTETTVIYADKESGIVTGGKISLSKFPLSNIDDMREKILQQPKTTPLELNSQNTQLPYSIITGYFTNPNDQSRTSLNAFEMAGIGIKTYLSDKFNNWLSTEWIDGANGISQITAVKTADGKFTIDSLNLATKLYYMLNRIAVSGGSYVDWQESVYGVKVMRRAETPMYMGGMSAEIVFNEVVSTADATAAGNEQPLGTLAGKGRDASHKNGTIRIKAQEPSFIMALVSLTPRIDYSQGNKWFTRLETMNDLHKPALDGIGFQELITDEMAAWDTSRNATGEASYKSAGKQPAWLNYMTSVSETYGGFANQYQEMFMTLNRRYEATAEGTIKDLTTYIDPTKYNYAFAVQELKAQNFWVQIAMDIKARRVMSAKLMPNL